MQRRDVEITVYDKQIDAVQVFRCDLALLEVTMVYFAPIIQRYTEEEMRQAKGTSLPLVSSSASNSQHPTQSLSPIPLRVNCDISIFAWLMAYVEGKQRSFTPGNAVSIALSSNFLLMKPLVDTSLGYIKDHLVQVMVSGVNMGCLTGDLIARLSSMLGDADLARVFLKFFNWRAEDSPNRRFLTALLRHVVCDRFGERSSTSLRWCQLCGVLFDHQDLQRAERHGCNLKPAVCPKLSPNCIGTRGEILKTHVASSHSVDLAMPSISWSDEHVERWAWRVIGSIYYYQCRLCNHLVFLVDAATHSCPGGTSNLVSLDNISRADADVLLTWYEAAKDLYDGGIEPLRSHQTDTPRKCVLVLSPSGEWTCDDGSERGAPGLWSTHPVAVEESVDSAGRVNLDAQNGFERWLMAELQHMMEGLGRPASPLSRLHSPAHSPAHSPLMGPNVEGDAGRGARPQMQRREKSFYGNATQRGRPVRFLPEQTRGRMASPMTQRTKN